MAIVAQSFDIGRDTYGRSVTATRKQTYDGKIIWEITSAPVNQRDDGERMSGLSDNNIRLLAHFIERIRS